MELKRRDSGLLTKFLRSGWEGLLRRTFLVVIFTTVAVVSHGEGLRINEVMGSNEWTWRDQNGDFPDWVELYNAGGEALNLGGYRLGKEESPEGAWVFPSVDLEPGGFLVVFASGDSHRDGQPFHTDFVISAGGDRVLLFDREGNILDASPFAQLPTDISLGRHPDNPDKWVYFTTPTPGAANHPSSHDRLIPPPGFSHSPGPYAEPFGLLLSHPDEGARIHYTLDGSTPTEDSALYKGPIEIRSREGDEGVYSYISTNYNASTPGPRRPLPMGTVVRARAFADDAVPSDVSTVTYFVEFNPVEHYGTGFVSLVADPDDLFSTETGIHVRGQIYEDTVGFWPSMHPNARPHYQPGNFHQRGRIRIPLAGLSPRQVEEGVVALPAANHGILRDFRYWRYAPHIRITGTEGYDGSHYFQSSSTAHELHIEADFNEEIFPFGAYIHADWERPMHVEYFTEGCTLELRRNLGVRIHGGASRTNPQKTFRLYARLNYDDKNYVDSPLMHHGGETRFRRFLLRRGEENSGMNCILATHLMWRFNRTLDIQHFRYVAVFLNGEFWGMKSFRDRLDQWYLANKYDVSPDDLVIVEETAGYISHGLPQDRQHYQTMHSFIMNQDLREEENFRQVGEWMDLDSYLDYTVASIYMVNTDWHSKHQLAWRYKGEPMEGGHPFLDGRWRWMPYDYDSALGRNQPASHDYLGPVLSNNSYFVGRLTLNPEYRRRFINRFADMMNTVFRPDVVDRVWEEARQDLNDQLITDHVDRWRHMGSLESWQGRYSALRSFLHARPAHMRQHLRQRYGLGGDVMVTVNVADKRGRVHVNGMLIDSDLDGVGEPAYPWSGLYFDGHSITVEAVPKPGYTFARWSGSSKATDPFIEIDPAQGLALTAHFRPAGPESFRGVFLPSTGQSGQPLRPVAVTVVDEEGRVYGDYEGTVSISLAEGPGNLLGTTSVPVVDGRASFDGLVLSHVGIHELRVTGEDLNGSLSWTVRVAGITEVLLPQYLQGDNPNNDRVPFVYRLRIEGLEPDMEYHMASRFVTADDPPDQNGAGNAFYTEPGLNQPFRTTATPDFADPGTHGFIHTDHSGSCEAWFIAEPSGNRRFAPGNIVYPRILLNDGNGGAEIEFFLTAQSPVRVLSFGEDHSQATGILGVHAPLGSRFVFLYDHEEGSGRPLSGTIVEDDEVPLDERYVSFYLEEVDGVDRAWGTLLPNQLSPGVRRLEYYGGSLTGPMAAKTAPLGIWGGVVDTRNPSSGREPIRLPSTIPDGNGWLLR